MTFIPLKDISPKLLSLNNCSEYHIYHKDLTRFLENGRISKFQFGELCKFPIIAKKAHTFTEIKNGSCIEYVEMRKDLKTPYFHHPIAVTTLITNTLEVSDPLAIGTGFIHDRYESLVSFGSNILKLNENEARKYAQIELKRFISENFPNRMVNSKRTFRKALEDLTLKLSHQNDASKHNWRENFDEIWDHNYIYFGSLVTVKGCDTPQNSSDPHNLPMGSNLLKTEQNIFNYEASMKMPTPAEVFSIDDAKLLRNPYYIKLHYTQGFEDRLQNLAKKGMNNILTHYATILINHRIIENSSKYLEETYQFMKEITPELIKIADDFDLSLQEVEKLAEIHNFNIGEIKNNLVHLKSK